MTLAASSTAKPAEEPTMPHEQVPYIIDMVRRHGLSTSLPLNECTSLRGGHVGLITKAAQDRGLTVTSGGRTRLFESHGRIIGAMRDMPTSLVSHVAVQVCQFKEETKAVWNDANVPTPRGIMVDMADPDALALARAFADQVDGPVVVKPRDGRAGQGVTTGIITDQDLPEALQRAAAAAKARPRVLVEEQVSGLDIRAFVVGDRVVAAVTRVPAFVVGDGRSSVSELVAVRQSLRAEHAQLARGEIVAYDSVLAYQGLSRESVPDGGQVVVLSTVANVHQGADTVAVTEWLSPELHSLALRAAKAIPGFLAGGIDLIARSPERPGWCRRPGSRLECEHRAAPLPCLRSGR